VAHAYGLDVKDSSVMAAFCDYDRDGWLDVYIATNLLDSAAHPSGQRGYLFHNNGRHVHNVTDAAGVSGETQSHSATWWDCDNDGWPISMWRTTMASRTTVSQQPRRYFTNAVDQFCRHVVLFHGLDWRRKYDGWLIF